VITTSDFRKGLKLLHNGEPYIVLDYQHAKRAQRAAIVRTKMKNLLTGLVQEFQFESGDKFDKPDLEYRDMQYLYSDGDLYHFMDQSSFDEIALSASQIEEIKDYLKEQTTYSVLYFESKPIAVTPPIFMELEVTDAPPGVKGDTAQGGGSKPVTVETGMVLQAPLFVDTGDIIKVDTREGKYVERLGKKK